MRLYTVLRRTVTKGNKIIFDWAVLNETRMVPGRETLEYDGVTLPITVAEDGKIVIVHLGETTGDLSRVILFDDRLEVDGDFPSAEELPPTDTPVRADTEERDVLYISRARGEGGFVLEAYRQGEKPQVNTEALKYLIGQTGLEYIRSRGVEFG